MKCRTDAYNSSRGILLNYELCSLPEQRTETLRGGKLSWSLTQSSVAKAEQASVRAVDYRVNNVSKRAGADFRLKKKCIYSIALIKRRSCIFIRKLNINAKLNRHIKLTLFLSILAACCGSFSRGRALYILNFPESLDGVQKFGARTRESESGVSRPGVEGSRGTLDGLRRSSSV